MLIEKTSLNTDRLIGFQEWKKTNGEDFSLWDYLFAVSNVEIAIAFSKLFWPDFVEYEDGIFLSEAFDKQTYKQWKDQLGNDIAARTDAGRFGDHEPLAIFALSARRPARSNSGSRPAAILRAA